MSLYIVSVLDTFSLFNFTGYGYLIGLTLFFSSIFNNSRICLTSFLHHKMFILSEMMMFPSSFVFV